MSNTTSPAIVERIAGLMLVLSASTAWFNGNKIYSGTASTEDKNIMLLAISVTALCLAVLLRARHAGTTIENIDPPRIHGPRR